LIRIWKYFIDGIIILLAAYQYRYQDSPDKNNIFKFHNIEVWIFEKLQKLYQIKISAISNLVDILQADVKNLTPLPFYKSKSSTLCQIESGYWLFVAG